MGLFTLFLSIAQATGFLAFLHALHINLIYAFWQWISAPWDLA